MSTLSDLVIAQGRSEEADVEWLHLLVGDWQLLADLAFADIVLWVPTGDGQFRRRRPRPPVQLGDPVLPRLRRAGGAGPSGVTQVTEAFETAQIVDSASPDWFEETPTRVRAVPVMRRLSPSGAATTTHPIAVHQPAHEPERGAHARAGRS